MESEDNIVAYRLGEVERAVRSNNEASQKRDMDLHRKLDTFLELKDSVTRNTFQIELLIQSRNRQIAAVSTIAIGVIMLMIQVLFKVV